MEDQAKVEPGRVLTGIEGLDKMLYGGVPATNQVVVSGGPGAGKTLLSFNIVYNNAKQGIPSVFITLDETPQNLVRNVKKSFKEIANEIDSLIEKRLIVVEGENPSTRLQSKSDSPEYTFGNIISDIESIVQSSGARVIVIDSVTLLKLLFGDEFAYRKAILLLTSNLHRMGVTSFLTVEMQRPERKGVRFPAEFFLFDGVISLYQEEDEEKRTLVAEIIKMRGSNHSWLADPYEITDSGINFIGIE